ncbi:MAG: phenylalanine--tRNA ligase subunit alpha [Candidatus Ratteibacteria bacterium]|nr:phenylalanine--tRNA ligase subunit alpha [Candidatus Ratteibacteria bacterium]
MKLEEIKKKIKEVGEKAVKEISTISEGDTEKLERWKVKYLGRKGAVNDLFTSLSLLSSEERKEAGIQINALKNKLISAYEENKSKIESKREEKKVNLSFPGKPPETGAFHPITLISREITTIFIKMGFGVVTGPEIETDYYNFGALNIPDEHPSKDVWDTFYIAEKEKILLRTHTSPVQVRIMEKVSPPLRIITIGKCFRRDDIDATHSPVFHQIEGLMVDRGINFSHLKGILTHFIMEMFGNTVKVKFTPSFFPFTEPSAEVSMSCNICKGIGCSTCHNTGYIEVLGCGMVHPQVFRNVGYNPDEFTGFAFGMGIERLAIIKFGITDIRYFFQNDTRVIKQFN